MGYLTPVNIAWVVASIPLSLLAWRLARDLRNWFMDRFFPDPDPPQTYREALDAEERHK